MHPIKVNRALRLSTIGRYPASVSAMLDAVPAEVVSALSARRLAAMLDAMWEACQESKRLALREAVAEGAIWDGERLREIAR